MAQAGGIEDATPEPRVPMSRSRSRAWPCPWLIVLAIVSPLPASASAHAAPAAARAFHALLGVGVVTVLAGDRDPRKLLATTGGLTALWMCGKFASGARGDPARARRRGGGGGGGGGADVEKDEKPSLVLETVPTPGREGRSVGLVMCTMLVGAVGAATLVAVRTPPPKEDSVGWKEAFEEAEEAEEAHVRVRAGAHAAAALVLLAVARPALGWALAAVGAPDLWDADTALLVAWAVVVLPLVATAAA
jgi:hypothetical protein